MSIKASNNPFPHDPDNFKGKLDRAGYEGTAQDLKDEIDLLANPDDILVKGAIVKTGNNISIAALAFTCRINRVVYTNPTSYSATINSATDNYQRIDILVFTRFSTIVKIQGTEGLESAQEPPTPPNTIKIAFFTINGSDISEATIPDSGVFVKKLESNDYVWNTNSAIVDNLTLLDERSSIAAGGSVLTDLKSLYISNLNVRSGKPLFFKNRTNRNIKLWHNAGSGTYKFFFPSGQDLIVKPNEIIEFSLNLPANRFELVGSDPEKFVSTNNQIEVSGNQTAQPSWHGKEVTFTGSGLLTIPGTLPEQYNFDLATDTGVTVTWAITSPKTWKFGTPPTMTEKDFCTVSQRLGTNEIRVRGL